MNNFFEETFRVTEDSLEDFNFYDSEEYIEKANSLHYDIAPNGGCILITRPLTPDFDFSDSPKELVNSIIVHRPDGFRLPVISLQDAVSVSFLPDERVLKVYPYGTIEILNPFERASDFRRQNAAGNSEAKSEVLIDLPHKKKFSATGEYKGIAFVKPGPNSFLIFTVTKHLYMFYDFESIKFKKLLDPDPSFNYAHFSAKSICYYSKALSKRSYFWVACLKSGILAFEFESKEVEKSEKILQNIPDQITHVSVNPNRKLLAALTLSNVLHVFLLKNMAYQRSFPLGFSEIEMRSFVGVEWLGEYSAVVCFQRFFYLVNSASDRPALLKGFSSGLNADRNSLLLYKTEVDGLRVIKMNPKNTMNVLIRRKSDAYEEVTSFISVSPGRQLYTYYKNILKKQPPESEEVMQNKQFLARGIEEVIEAAKFALKESKQKKLLQAACEGKVFLGDQDFTHNVIYQTCKSFKLFTALASQTKRAMSFEQFSNVVNNDFAKLIQFLINARQFELAFYCCVYNNKEQHFVTEIFQKWVSALISRNSDAAKVAAKIVNTFRKLESLNKNIQSTILIDAANEAFGLGKVEVTKHLLEQRNPPLLKIALYINLGMYEVALKLSVQTNDSNCIYAVLSKIVERKSESEAIFLINSTKDPVIYDHFVRFLSANADVAFLTNFVRSIGDSKLYLVREYERVLKSRKFDKLKPKADALAEIFGAANAKHIAEKKTESSLMMAGLKQMKVAGEVLGGEPSATHITADVIMKKFFDADKSRYLEQGDSKFDSKFLEKAKELGLSEKKMHLMRIDYMLRNLAGKNLDSLYKHIQANRRVGYSLVQLKLMFDATNHADDFYPVMELFGHDAAYNFAINRNMLFEAGNLAIDAGKREEFEQIVSSIRDASKRERLLARAAGAFKK